MYISLWLYLLFKQKLSSYEMFDQETVVYLKK